MPYQPQPDPSPSGAELALRLALVPVLLGWSKVCVRPRDSDPIDADMVELYADSLAEIRVTPDELASARRAMLRTNKFFPSISEITRYVLDHRDGNPYKGWLCCEDEDGLPWVAPAHMVLNGVFRPQGGGNGLPLPPREERDGDEEKVDRLLNARDVRRPLALGGRTLPQVGSETGVEVPPDMEAELIQKAREWNELSPEEKLARRAG